MSPDPVSPDGAIPPAGPDDAADFSIESLVNWQSLLEARSPAAPRRSVTCLFADLIGSTRIYDVYGDAVGRSTVQAQMDLCSPCIVQHGGRLVKTIGDALFAVFPTPAQAVSAAVGMQRALSEYNTLGPAVPLHVRIGAHHGEAYVEEADVFGDVVNTAARVVQLVDHPSIVFTEAVWRGCDAATRRQCVNLGSFELRGKREKTPIYLHDWDDSKPAPEEFVCEGTRIRRLTLDWEHPLVLRVVDGFLFGLGCEALACSHTTFARHVQGIRHHYDVEEGVDEDARVPVIVYRRSLPGDPRICLVYDFDAFDGASHAARLDALVGSLAAQVAQARIRSMAFRMPHRLRGVDLQVAQRHAASSWVRRLAREPGCRALDFVIRDDMTREERAEAVAQVLAGVGDARKAEPSAARCAVPTGWLVRGGAARELKRLIEGGIGVAEDGSLGGGRTATVTVWGEARVAYPREPSAGRSSTVGLDAT